MKVKVIKAQKKSYWYSAHIGDVFDVVECNKYDSKYRVVGEEKYFVEEDVELVNEQPKFPFKVRCIDITNAEHDLVLNAVYTVTGQSAGDYYLKETPWSYMKSRFEVITEEETVKEQPVRNKYMREIKPDVWVDVYDVLRAWEVTDPCLQHLLKKALQPGKRYHKDLGEDLKDILASAKRAVEMYEEWNQ